MRVCQYFFQKENENYFFSLLVAFEWKEWHKHCLNWKFIPELQCEADKYTSDKELVVIGREMIV